MSIDKKKPGIPELLAVMARLRDPAAGCPWDLEQNFASIAPHTIEEAYEVADAIAHGSRAELRDELGDLLFQVVFHAQLAAEEGAFNFDDVVAGVTEKMISRHPHIFGSGHAATAADVNAIWEARKDLEGKRQQAASALDDVPRALPALKRAQKLLGRAARVGFEWPDVAAVLDKMEEEMAELRAAIVGGRAEEVKDELGDLFFVLVNLGRKLGADSEEALSGTNEKFIRRFKAVEAALKARGVAMEDAGLGEMEKLWREAKVGEK